MLIDWFTVCAQVVNFLILVWLLRRFLYRPVLDAIDAREKKIAAELADAVAKKAEAQIERDDFSHKNELFDKHHAALMSKARTEASDERKRLLDLAHQEADALRAKQAEALANEQKTLADAITRRTRDEVFAISRKTLSDLASAGLEEQMTGVFLRRLQGLSDKEKRELTAAFSAPGSAPVVRSTFDLPPDARSEIEAAIHGLAAFTTPVSYEAAPDALSGIELSANGWKIGWNIEEYLASFEQGVADLLSPAKKSLPPSKPEPKPVHEPNSKPKSKPAPVAP